MGIFIKSSHDNKKNKTSCRAAGYEYEKIPPNNMSYSYSILKANHILEILGSAVTHHSIPLPSFSTDKPALMVKCLCRSLPRATYQCPNDKYDMAAIIQLA